MELNEVKDVLKKNGYLVEKTVLLVDILVDISVDTEVDTEVIDYVIEVLQKHKD